MYTYVEQPISFFLNNHKCLFQAQEPRKKNSNLQYSYEEAPIILDQSDDDISCSAGSCLKRSGQDELGPFWANRGKKDPSYSRNQLFVDEPRWILVRRDDRNHEEKEPFFLTRGKKMGRMWNLARKLTDGDDFGYYVKKDHGHVQKNW